MFAERSLPTTQDVSRPSLFVWIRATWLGWLLGIPCVAGLALLAESLGIGGTQTMVGAGMGLAVGVLQVRVLRRHGIPALHWISVSVLGLTIPFLVWDLAHAVGARWSYSLFLCVTLGGLAAGAGQAVLLRRRLGPPWWIGASTTGWGLAAALVTAADALFQTHVVRGLAGAILNLVLLTTGGALLGGVTGLVLNRKWVGSLA